MALTSKEKSEEATSGVKQKLMAIKDVPIMMSSRKSDEATR